MSVSRQELQTSGADASIETAVRLTGLLAFSYYNHLRFEIPLPSHLFKLTLSSIEAAYYFEMCLCRVSLEHFAVRRAERQDYLDGVESAKQLSVPPDSARLSFLETYGHRLWQHIHDTGVSGEATSMDGESQWSMTLPGLHYYIIHKGGEYFAEEIAERGLQIC